MKKTLTFLFLWLCWGFTLGTLLLLGPLRWAVDFGREQAWEENTEKSAVYLFIAVLALVSAGLAWLSYKKVFNHHTSNIFKGVLFTVPVIGIAMAIYVFMHPDWINTDESGKEEKISAQFGVGPYPELVKMYQLKGEGYTAVISLLHPAVVPFEPTLIEKEKKDAEQAGLTFINIPLLPWISDNKEAIDSLRRLVRTANGKYYVHCYLGKDRTNAAGRIIKQENSVMIDLGIKKKDGGLLDSEFERGPVVQLEKDVYLAPLPTKEEYFDVVVDFQQVVSLSNFSNAEARQRDAEEQQWLQAYKIAFKAINVNENTSDRKIQEIVKQVKELPRPVFIHGFFPDDKEMVLFKSLYLASLKK